MDLLLAGAAAPGVAAAYMYDPNAAAAMYGRGSAPGSHHYCFRE